MGSSDFGDRLGIQLDSGVGRDDLGARQKVGIADKFVSDERKHDQFRSGFAVVLSRQCMLDEGIDIGFELGKKGSKNENRLGAFVVELESGVVVHVGGGLSDDQRDDFWNRRGELLGQWIQYRQDLVPSRMKHKLKARFPQFEMFRPDKTK